MGDALRPAFDRIRLVGALRGVVWCPHSTVFGLVGALRGVVWYAQRGSTGRCDAWSKRRLNRRFDRRFSRRIGLHSRSNGSGPRVESDWALGSSPTGPSGRIPLGQKAIK